MKIIVNYASTMPYLFSIFWIVSSLILILNIKSIIREENFFLFLFIVFHFLLYIGIYLITPYNLEWHLRTSFDREIMHIVPIYGFLIGIMLLKKKVLVANSEKKINYIIIGAAFLTGTLIFIIV